MKPDPDLVTIHDNAAQVEKLLHELVLTPRAKAIEWAAITKQTPNIKIGYPGQHLASVISGMEGERTAARGNDLTDGSEVKSCNRIDQLDKCKDCDGSVARTEESCAQCSSSNIERKGDSKWLFAVKNEDELDLLLNRVGRVLLILSDYPNFDKEDWNTLRFQGFEIWPEYDRHSRFREIMEYYYYHIYLYHINKNPNKTPAPKNFWPYSFQFYICNPIRTFSCTVTHANSNPQVEIEYLVEPAADRSGLESEVMPPDVLYAKELDTIVSKANTDELKEMMYADKLGQLKRFKSLKKAEKADCFIGIDEKLRAYLPLRDKSKASTAKSKWQRSG